jgi:myo-inositol-1-phosphate synthase
MAKKIKVAIAGVGNCASALVQGIQYYKSNVSGEKVANNSSDISSKGSQNSSSLPDDDFNSMTESSIGLTSYDIGGYVPGDIEFVAAFDVADAKVGSDLSEAIFASPNNAIKIMDVPSFGVKVQKGDVLDGAGRHFS